MKVEDFTIKKQIEIEIPRWEYCNEQETESSKKSTMCKFLVGSKGEYFCRIYGGGCYSNLAWIKKCNDCLEKGNK